MSFLNVVCLTMALVSGKASKLAPLVTCGRSRCDECAKRREEREKAERRRDKERWIPQPGGLTLLLCGNSKYEFTLRLAIPLRVCQQGLEDGGELA
jgi:hypothetical protein